MVDSKRKGRSGSDSLFDNSSIKVLIIGCVVIIAAMLFMSVTSILIMKKAVVTKLKTNDMANLAESFGAVIEGKIDKAVDASLMLSHDPVIINWVEGKENDEQAAQLVKTKMGDMVHRFGYETSFLVSSVTKHYWSYHEDTFSLLDTVSQTDPSDRWFFTTMKMGKEYEINIDFNKELGDTFVWVNALAGDTSNPIAVTGLGMNLSQVMNDLILEEKRSKVKNDIWLVNGEGVIHLAKSADYLDKNIAEVLPSSLIGRISGYMAYGNQFDIDQYVNAQGDTYDIAYRRIKDTDWKLIIQIPRAETTGFLSTVTLNTVISGFAIILIMLLIFFILSNRIANPYKRAVQLNKELESIVEERTNELKEKNSKIQDSIDYARSIQQTILPSDDELKRNLKDYFILFEPKDTVGGDFYWMRQSSKGLLLAVGDCTGHGVAGALMTTAVNAMLNQIAEEHFDNPAQILQELDKRIKEFVRQDSSEEIIPYGLDAAVFFIPKEGRALYAGANLSIFVLDGDKVKEVAAQNDTIDCMVRRKPKPFENQMIEYNENCVFYFVTDGYREQPGGERMLPFGRARLLNLLYDVSKLPLLQQREELLRVLQEYQGSGIRRDDVTVFGFEI